MIHCGVKISMTEKEILEQPLKAADMAWSIIWAKKRDEIIMEAITS